MCTFPEKYCKVTHVIIMQGDMCVSSAHLDDKERVVAHRQPQAPIGPARRAHASMVKKIVNMQISGIHAKADIAHPRLFRCSCQDQRSPVETRRLQKHGTQLCSQVAATGACMPRCRGMNVAGSTSAGGARATGGTSTPPAPRT